MHYFSNTYFYFKKHFKFQMKASNIVFVWYISVETAEMELKINYKIWGSKQNRNLEYCQKGGQSYTRE